MRKVLGMKQKIVFTALAAVFFLFGCTNATEGSAPSSTPLDDAAYFEAAKSYITYNNTFGPQTDLTSNANLKKVQFHSLPSQAKNHAFQWGNLAKIVTARKTLIANSENNLIMIKRLQASRKDDTTMTVTMTTGNKMTRHYVPGGGFQHWPDGAYYKKGTKTDQCERIVFNADGVGVCLNPNGSSIVMTELSQKFGHRLVTSCVNTGAGNEVACNKYNKLFSSKRYDPDTNTLTLDTFY